MTDKQCKGNERCEDFECKKPGKITVLANQITLEFLKVFVRVRGGKGDYLSRF